MGYEYKPRGMPARFMVGAPEIVRKGVIDILGPFENAVCEYDVILRPQPGAAEIVGLDFGVYGSRGCHFFLKPHEARDYRESCRRNKRVAWSDLPAATQSAILAYLESE